MAAFSPVPEDESSVGLPGTPPLHSEPRPCLLVGLTQLCFLTFLSTHGPLSTGPLTQEYKLPAISPVLKTKQTQKNPYPPDHTSPCNSRSKPPEGDSYRAEQPEVLPRCAVSPAPPTPSLTAQVQLLRLPHDTAPPAHHVLVPKVKSQSTLSIFSLGGS